MAAGPISITGSGQIFSGKYDQMLPKWGDWLAKLTYGIDYRLYTNRVKADASSESLVPDAAVHPFSLTYSGSALQDQRMISGGITYAHNLPGGANGTTDDFTQPGGRAGATASYQLWRYNLSLTQFLPSDWMLKGALNGQTTRDALISGEQFGAGGADSVRGFYEREVANDKGHRASVELYSPDLPSLQGSASEFKARVLAFVDVAQLGRNQIQPGELEKNTISSYGLGLRGAFGKQLTYRLDWGVIDRPGSTPHKSGDQHVHGAIIKSF
jgi:hemolysin activation/secretion protein